MSDLHEIEKRRRLNAPNLYEDPDFPADSTVLYKGGTRFGVRWKRPQEISPNPVFIDEGTVYFDIDQGNLGDCWFLSSVACIAASPHKDILSRVVPKDQGYGPGYTGAFRFNFWRYGKWVEVVVDDRLPTYNGELIYGRNKDNPQEYWCPLLEKAYAKLNGNYHVIDGGRLHTAMVDLTGGLGEMVELKEKISDQELSGILLKCQKMNSFMGAAVFNQNLLDREVRADTGLVQGHAYTVVNVKEVLTARGKVTLVHLRNPHGYGEWKGDWSDNSREWNTLSSEDRKATSLTQDNGEFWMSVSDFRKHIDELELCHMTPDALTSEIADNLSRSQWQVTEHYGSWVRGRSAGGPPISFLSEKFWSNPQYELRIPKTSDQKTVVISLMEVDVLTERMETDISIGFAIFQHNEGPKPVRITAENYYEFSPRMVETSGAYWPYRERTVRFVMKPGDHVIVPYTSRAGQEAKFYMRIFAEGDMDATPMDTSDPSDRPTNTTRSETSKEKDALDKAFKKLAGTTGQIDAQDLIQVLSAGLAAVNGSSTSLNVETCRSLIGASHSPSGLLNRDGLNKVWSDLSTWLQAFQVTDKNKSGTVDVQELTGLFEIIELRPAADMVDAVMRRYGGKKKSVTREDFLQSVCRVINLHDMYRSLRREGKISMELKEWMLLGLSI